MNAANPIRNAGKAKEGRIALAIALALALGILPLAACSNSSQPAASDSASSAAEQAAETPAAIDTSSWKTLGDALAIATSSPNAGWDEEYYVCDFEAGESVIYAVAKMQPGVSEKLMELDFSDKDYDKKLVEAIGGMELVSAEDITGHRMDQATLDGFVGKTGQELFDDGFAFSSYYFYGGEETGATLNRDYFAYTVTFDTSITEKDTEDEGASLKDAKVTAIECEGTAASLLDPETVK